MKERPIIFSGPMVRAILADRKTQTRRIIKPQPDTSTPGYWAWSPRGGVSVGLAGAPVYCRYGMPGDRLWIRETWALVRPSSLSECGRYVEGWEEWDGELPDALPSGWRVVYAAEPGWETDFDDRGFRWRSPLFAKRWASRLTVEIDRVRIERVQDAEDRDIEAEGIRVNEVAEFTGIPWSSIPDMHTAWRYGWEHIHGLGSFDSNPWVFAITFRRVSR
jgi:hypothetical protein